MLTYKVDSHNLLNKSWYT